MRKTGILILCLWFWDPCQPPLALAGTHFCEEFEVAPKRMAGSTSPLILPRVDADLEVDSATEVYKWLVEISTWMEVRLGLKVQQVVVLKVCDQVSVSSVEGLESPTLGSFQIYEETRVLTLRRGLVRRRLVQVLAHEWVHAWQSEQCPPKQSLLIHEGLAQWGVAELLKDLCLEEDLEILKAREDFYGEAYRWVADYEKEHGREALVDYVRQAR